MNYYKLIFKCLESINKFKYKFKIINKIKYVCILVKNGIIYINCYSIKFVCVLFKYLLFFPFFIAAIYSYILSKTIVQNDNIQTIVYTVKKQINTRTFLNVNLINAWKKWYYIDIQLSKICSMIKKKLLNTNNYIILKPLYKINFFIEK